MGVCVDDNFFTRLKNAYDTNCQEEFSAFLYEEAQIIMSVELKKSVFSVYSAEDKEDARQEALLYLLSRIDEFMCDPRNYPVPSYPMAYYFTDAQKRAWLHKTLYYGLLHFREKVIRMRFVPTGEGTGKAAIDSLDREVFEKNERAVSDFYPSAGRMVEDIVLLREKVYEACNGLFSLGNSPEILAAVGFVILSEALWSQRYSLTEYADILNGRPVIEIVNRIEQLLQMYEVDTTPLQKLKERIEFIEREAADGMLLFEGFTPKSLANRKNSILSKLREKKSKEDPS